jgi:hypothetical protein
MRRALDLQSMHGNVRFVHMNAGNENFRDPSS